MNDDKGTSGGDWPPNDFDHSTPGSSAPTNPIQNPEDLLGEALRLMNARQQESIFSKAADEAIRLGVKQSEGAVDRDMVASKVEAVADAVHRLGSTSTDVEIRTEHRSQHGSIYVTVRNAPPPLVARISPRLAPIPRWVASVVIAVATSIGLIGVGIWATGGRSSGNPSTVAQSSPALNISRIAAIQVIDGDTLVVSGVGGTGLEERIRLLAIDTPERGQRWYSEAGNALRELVANSPITLEYETPGKLERDKYGRVLAYLIVDGQNVNVEMVRRGWTAHVTKYGSNRFANDFSAAEGEARAAQRGIWSSP
ncbi:MAG: thermonuclease family protein [Phycisphaeraceae bacterium]|nr:thermonuclease family protein [Phycisphaeraceae bacterium]MCW5761790.1 thermonuclease family protein [Phycisphaeraceae bacterium]